MGRSSRWWLSVLLAAGAGVTAVEIAVLNAAGAGSGARWANWLTAWWVVLPALPIGWSFVAVGLVARWRRPGNRVGVLMTAVGFGELASGVWMVPVSLVSTVGLVVTDWFVAVLVHLLLAFPSGRSGGRVGRALVTAGYLIVLPSNLVPMFFLDFADIGPPGVHDLLLVHADSRLGSDLANVTGSMLVGLLAVTSAVLVRRWRRGTSAQRRALAPVLVVGALFTVFTGLRIALPGQIGLLGLLIAQLAIPYAFLAGLLRIRFFQMRALGELMTELGEGRYAGDLPTALAAAFDDVPVQLVYWLADLRCHVDQAGRPVELPSGDGRTVLPVQRDGRRLGAIIVDAAVASEESQLITGLLGAVELAMDNQRLDAELRARVLELERSRAQVVEAGEAQRQQLERNLHDGAQQLLVTVRLRLGLIRQTLAAQTVATPAGALGRPLGEVGIQVDSAMTDLDAALAELRELAHGLHPMLLSTRGLASAVRSLAARAPLPIRLDLRLPRRLPEPVESTAYFVIAESLTNVAKHAAATCATVTVAEHPGRLLIEVLDDGIGGADPAGSGLRGLAARLAAHDGRLHVGTAAEGGTVVRAEIPLPGDGGTDRSRR